MKKLMLAMTVGALLTSPVAIAQSGNGNNSQRSENLQHEGRQWHPQSNRWDNGRHRGWGRERGDNARWGRGQQMGYNDWRRAHRVDYRRHNLRQPPRGYEWRRTNDRYVMASTVSGMIISVIRISQR